MNTEVVKTIFDIAYVNVLFIIMVTLVALSILLIAIGLFDLFTDPIDNYFYHCYPVLLDGCA